MIKAVIKKSLSLLLIASFVMGMCILSGAVTESVYPESEHNYQDNFKGEWYYEYPENADGIYVTFSQETSFEKPETISSQLKPSENGRIIIFDKFDEKKKGDYLYISGSDGFSLSATGKELSGKTVYIPGKWFSLCLETDSSVTDYGFSIERISHIPPDDVAVVTYECCDGCGVKKLLCYNEGEELKVACGYHCNIGNSAFISWISEDGCEYNEGESLPFASIDLKARRIDLLLNNDEVLSFSNSDPYFDPDYNGGYYLSDEDYRTMKRNIYKVFGYGILPAIGLSIAFSTYPDWYWNGSCYGMSTLAFLQHYGAVDVLEGRSEKSISELKNEDSVISMINYYQWAAAGSFLCENFALNKGSKIYSKQLENLFESVSSGNIVLFTYYPEGIFSQGGHTVLLTGAYTQKDGTKVLITYDPNRPEDYCSQTYTQRFYIDSAFTAITRGYSYPANYYAEVGAFNWTDDYEHFNAFDINNEGKVSSWYSHYFSQLFSAVKMIFSLI